MRTSFVSSSEYDLLEICAWGGTTAIRLASIRPSDVFVRGGNKGILPFVASNRTSTGNVL
jgi:hypothetical protein